MKQRTAFIGTLMLGVLALFAGTPSLRAQTTDAPRIKLQSVLFDPRITVPSVPSALQTDLSKTLAPLMLVQFVGPIEEAWKTAAQNVGARLLGYVPDHTLIARLSPQAQQYVQQLPFVRWVGSYHPAYKLDQAFASAAPTSNEMITLDVHAVPDMDVAAFEQQISQWSGTVLDHATNEWATYVRANVPADRLADVARTNDVLWIAPYTAPNLLNSVAGGTIMSTTSVRSSLDLYGRGQVIAVADTGLDTGAQATLHGDVQGRVLATYCLGRPKPCDWSDPHGHGTHVVGSALGNGTQSGSNAGAHHYAGSQAGVAPEASLVMQSISDAQHNLSGIPADAGNLMRQAYRDGARIHTNSWGSYSASTYGSYTTRSHQVDAAAWEHKDLLVLFAAGNNGVDANKDGVVDADALMEEGSAKNVLTVGASENVQPQMPGTWGDMPQSRFPAAPLVDDPVANNANGMAAFSSRGPTDDGRIKPDIVAPGTYILSMRSRQQGAGTGWAAYNNDYVYNGGTSMATPLTAGAAAVTREWLSRMRGIAHPSAALVKALLLNGAASMGSSQYSTKPDVPATQPNPVNGWGRVDLEETLQSTGARTTWFADNTAGLTTGGRMQYTVHVGDTQGQTRTNSLPASQQALLPLPATTEVQNVPMNEAQSLGNGSFERGIWTPWQTYGGPQLADAVRRTGTWSAHMGGKHNAQDQLIQAVSVPNDAKAVTLSFWYRAATAETVANADQVCFGVWPATGTTPHVVRCLDMAKIGSRDWAQEAYTLSTTELAAVKGQTLRVALYMISNDTALSEVWVDDVALITNTSSAAQPAVNEPVRVMLAWTDYPAQPAAAKALVNDLDLEVIAPNGARYRGNAGAYPSTHRCMRNGQWDMCNNVEGVTLPFVPGQYTIVVHGANVPQGGKQPFAVVASGDYAQQVFGNKVFVPAVK